MGRCSATSCWVPGLTADSIRSWQRSGRLVVLHRGVYLLGSLVGPLCPARHREMAAVLACGRGAAVSHWSALWLRDLLRHRPGGAAGPVELVLPGRRCRRPGVVAHNVAELPAGDVGPVDGIPTTTTLRTIMDIAAVARPRVVEQVIARAEKLGQLDRGALLARLERAGPLPGARLLRSLLSDSATPAFTRSEAEDRFLDLIRRAELPEPRVNVRHGSVEEELRGAASDSGGLRADPGGRRADSGGPRAGSGERRAGSRGPELDFLFPSHGVAVEVDGYAHHSSRYAFESDRDRDFELGAGGIQVLRVTWRQLEKKPYVVVRRLTAVLTRAEVLAELAGRVRK